MSENKIISHNSKQTNKQASKRTKMLFYPLAWLLMIVVGQCKMVITSPKLGAQLDFHKEPVQKLKLQWHSDNDDDAQVIQRYKFTLCSGPGDQITNMGHLLTLETVRAQGEVELSIDSRAGTDGYYYVQIFQELSGASYVIQYTVPIHFIGMRGEKVANKDGTLKEPAMEAELEPESELYGDGVGYIPYYKQMGPVKYAPMHTQPPSAEVRFRPRYRGSWRMKNPSTAVTFYSEPRMSPIVLTTLTPPRTYVTVSYTHLDVYKRQGQ